MGKAKAVARPVPDANTPPHVAWASTKWTRTRAEALQSGQLFAAVLSGGVTIDPLWSSTQ